MIIINSKGGLGNQMFQYALYLSLRKAGKDAQLCLEHFDWASKEQNNKIVQHGKKFLIEDVFDTTAVKASSSDIKRMSNVGMDFYSRVKRKLGIEKKTHLYEEKMGNPSFDLVKSLDNVFLDGYWQRFDYYDSSDEFIRKEFSFKKPLSGDNLAISQDIQKNNSVSLHVRRNDYLKLPSYVIQDEKYFSKAMQIAADVLSYPVFYCFSDDIEWCKQNLKSSDSQIVFVDWNTGSESYRDMQLMSMCKINIITNSTFSMWAAWLNKNAKMVIRPYHYYTNTILDQSFYWPTQWIVPD